MALRYKIGTRDNVICLACELATGVEQSFIEAITPKYGTISDETKCLITLSETRIEDFKKLKRSVLDRNR